MSVVSRGEAGAAPLIQRREAPAQWARKTEERKRLSTVCHTPTTGGTVLPSGVFSTSEEVRGWRGGRQRAPSDSVIHSVNKRCEEEEGGGGSHRTHSLQPLSPCCHTITGQRRGLSSPGGE